MVDLSDTQMGKVAKQKLVDVLGKSDHSYLPRKFNVCS